MTAAVHVVLGHPSILFALLSALLLPIRSAGLLSPRLGGWRDSVGLSLPSAQGVMLLSSAADGSRSPTSRTTDASSSEVNTAQQQNQPKAALPREPRKSHCATVCAVPPPSAAAVWEALTRARRELRDPGFYRWPPHANLLYPFLELKSMKKRKEQDDEGPLFDEEMLDALERAAARCQPFEVTICRLGAFGGRSRGVLWAYPRSYNAIEGDTSSHEEDTSDADFCNPSEPMIQLQSFLEDEFPTCTEQRKQRLFHPHITLSHYGSLDDASKAKEQIEEWWEPITFTMSEVYVLRRVGDEGQFKIAATLPLGVGDEGSRCRRYIQVHDPPISFTGMPEVEEDWVNEERMKLKARRKSSWRNRSRRRGGGRKRRNMRNKERIPDTPEVIAAKRAARKAKREATEKEAIGRIDDLA